MLLSDKRDLVKHWKTIEIAYKKAPYFNEIQTLLAPLYNSDFVLLEDFCSQIIIRLCEYIGIKTKIIKSSEIEKEGEKSDLILSICKQLDAKTYLTGSGGLEYLNKPSFEEANIDIKLMDYRFLKYSQINNKAEFIKELSILDLVFNTGKNSINYL